jgi:hypothetical protein
MRRTSCCRPPTLLPSPSCSMRPQVGILSERTHASVHAG